MTATLDWQEFLLDCGLEADLISRYVPYVEKCIEIGVPPIFEDRHLALLLGREIGDMYNMIHGTGKFYRSFRIRKRSGGTREIMAPYPSLLECQRWINDKILSTVNLSKSATGYRKGYSILTNANRHCGRETLIKIDIRNFFPSIEFRRVMSVFSKLGYPKNVSYALARLCTLNDHLPQGAATSPAISNIICKKMDDQFFRLCKKKSLRYTRYSDDIAISGREIPKGTIRHFFEIIESYGFEVNEEKFRIIDGQSKKILTGIDISSGIPRVPRSFRRAVMRDSYFVWSSGLASHVARRRLFEPNYLEQLLGRLNFWRSIEPDNEQMKKALCRVQSVVSALG